MRVTCPRLDRVGQKDQQLWRIGREKLEGTDAPIVFPQAENDHIGLRMPGGFQGSAARIDKPSTPWAREIDELAHWRSVHGNGPRVNGQIGGVGSAR